MSERTVTIELAKALIERESVTPNDAGCQKLMADRLESIGFKCEHLSFGEGEEAVDNLWAVFSDNESFDNEKRNESPIFCFAGHTDVVPTGDVNSWAHPPFSATIEEGMLIGRGAADMKGSLAAMITATENFLANNSSPLKGRIAFLITSDEEGSAINGTVKVMDYLESINEKITWCLVGEPSSIKSLGDVVKNGRRGSLNAYLTVKGVQGHVAYPLLAKNPIHQILPMLDELNKTEWDQGNDFFPATSFQISNMNSGTGATNVIPGAIDIVFNFRFSTESTAEGLKASCKAIFEKHQLNYDIRWELSGEPFITERGELIDATVDAIQAVTGLDTQLLTTGGTSDGRFIAPTGTQLVELGPVNATIHKVDECVSVKDLEQLKLVYQDILKRLLL